MIYFCIMLSFLISLNLVKIKHDVLKNCIRKLNIVIFLVFSLRIIFIKKNIIYIRCISQYENIIIHT